MHKGTDRGPGWPLVLLRQPFGVVSQGARADTSDELRIDSVWRKITFAPVKKNCLNANGGTSARSKKSSLFGMPRGRISAHGVNPAVDPKHPHERRSTDDAELQLAAAYCARIAAAFRSARQSENCRHG